MRIPTFVVAVGLTICSAQAGEQAAAVTGVGQLSCAEFAKLYQANPDKTALMFTSWSDGLMTGLNMWMIDKEKQFHNLGALRHEGREMAVRDYCDKHPLATFATAVVNVYLSMPLHSDDK